MSESAAKIQSLPLVEGQVVTGTLFSEPMRVETIRAIGPETWVVGLSGVNTERFRKVTLTSADIQQLQIQKPHFTYHGDGQVLKIGVQAYSLGIAYEFDPYFGLSISRVDPLPHQLEAVYDYLLKLARVRFLLADDAGAGKTIMAGLLIRELKLRGLAERVLIICPANLTFQWQRELKEKFEEKFVVLNGDLIREQFGINQWLETPMVITSLDLAKRDNILPGLKQVRWDLVIVDEAHRMSWTPPSKKVCFMRKDTRSKKWLVTRYSIEDFVLILADHIPDRYRHAIRYFGLLAPGAKGRTDRGVFAVLRQTKRPRPVRLSWAASIKRDFGRDPLLDNSGRRMRWVRRAAPQPA